jgi:predicted TIM-barrel fold metal-dependent hydrolase
LLVEPAMDLAHLPLFDHHAHSLRREDRELDAEAFRLHFSESRDPRMAKHVGTSLFYRRAIRDLARFYGCAAEEAAVLAARSGRPAPERARQLFAAAGIDVLLLDTGFRSGESYTVEEQRSFLPCAVREVLRLETLAEGLIGETESFADFEEAYRAAVAGARTRGIAALKSIAAYRGGLAVGTRTRAEAKMGFARLKEAARRGDAVRLAERPLLEYLLRAALASAAAQELPIQFHTGFGDDDADLRTANPLLLRPLLQDPALRAVRFVLLHAWPYAREAGYLAGIYGNVYVDLSLAIPHTAHGGAAAILAALEQAPTSKVLLATDAASMPELFYLGARYARTSLGQALEHLERTGWLTAGEREPVARQLLHENAANLYGREL